MVPPVSWREAFWTWCRIAALSFGGPAGQIAVMHRILVDEKRWISEERFLHALNYCMLLPGPEAQQLATYVGWLLHRTRGGIVAGFLFIVPGFVSILALSFCYVLFQQSIWIQAFFVGLKPAVLAIVLEAVIRIGKRVLKHGRSFVIAVAAFLAIMLLAMPFPVLIACAALLGFLLDRMTKEPDVLDSPAGKPLALALKSSESHLEPEDNVVEEIVPTWRRSMKISVIALSLWFAPLIAIHQWLGSDHVLFQEGLFFSKAATVTFGGAYSVLAYVAQQAVDNFAWLNPAEMLDGLGMAETTPGPLIMVVQFVGLMGAYRNPGALHPLLAATLGAVLTTWVTFVPCFYWIFLGAPYVERVRGNRVIRSSLEGVTSAVVGVIAYLAVWFSLHTLFETVYVRNIAGTRWFIPDIATLDPAALLIALGACILMFWIRCGLGVTLVLSVVAGALVHVFR